MSQVPDERRRRQEPPAAVDHRLAGQAVVAVELDEPELVDAADDQARLLKVPGLDGGHQRSGF